MYVAEIDLANAVLLGINRTPKKPDDIDLYAGAYARVADAATTGGKSAVFIMIPEPGYPSPNSAERHRYAALKDGWSSPNLFILVTRSALLRGVMTAVSWLSPFTERQRAVACESFADVLVEVGRYRGDAVRPLQRMYATLYGRLDRRASV